MDLTAVGGHTEEEASLHSNVLELRATFLAFFAFQNRVMGHITVLKSDNLMVMV